MGYDESAAERLRGELERLPAVAEIRMFGGLCFTSRGHMVCGVLEKDLVLRVGPEGYAAALRRPHARPMDFTGRPLKGFVFVAPAGYATAAGLRRWLDLAVGFVGTLPDKKPPRRPRRAALR